MRSENGGTLFPAALLSKAMGAKLKWDAKHKIMFVAFGKANIAVISPDTAELYKKEWQGSLVAYIGKTYWVNHFQDWERFIKVTVVDVIPVDQGKSFKLVFRKTNGAYLTSYQMDKEYLRKVLKEEHYFFATDPVKKYKWPQKTWNLIKQEKIATGMTKEQVRMSWGNPSNTSTLTSGGITVETWGYSGFNYVTFTNGKVSAIYVS